MVSPDLTAKANTFMDSISRDDPVDMAAQTETLTRLSGNSSYIHRNKEAEFSSARAHSRVCHGCGKSGIVEKILTIL